MSSSAAAIGHGRPARLANGMTDMMSASHK
jgi:hypothetical protein